MAKNAYAKRLDAARAAREYAIRRYTRQQMLDFVTMDVREKMVELLDIIIQPGQKTLGDIADHLIANGVTVQECKLGAKKTNADRIRSMNDEELAMLLYEIGYDGGWGAPKYALDWLQQPAEEVNNG